MSTLISKTLDPKQYITESDVRKLIEKLDEFREQNNWRNFTFQAARIKCLNPGLIGSHITEEDEVKSRRRYILTEMSHNLKKSLGWNSLFMLAE